MSRPEKNYCVTRKEMLVMVYFVHEFKPYLLGKRFTIRTDHSALTWLMSFKEPTGQVARWIQKLQEYDYKIEYRPNAAHRNADAMSRRPNRKHGDCPTCQNIDPEISIIQWPFPFTAEDLKKAQREYGPTAKIMDWLDQGLLNLPDQVDGRCLKKYAKNYQLYRIIEGLLHIRKANDVQWRLVLPPDWREVAMTHYHDNPTGGHNGKDMTHGKIKTRYWWPNMRSRIDAWVDTCGICGQCRGPNPRHRATLQPIEVNEPFHRIAIDIVGPLPPTLRGNRFILVIVDVFSKWSEAISLPNHTAKQVATAILQNWIARYGVPKEILSDQYTEFESALFQHFCNMLGIKKIRSAPYHPSSNGAVERLNRTLKNLLLSHTTHDRRN